MKLLIERVYLDLRTDFAFKKCFGDESTMRAFLNVILGEDYGIIKNVKFENVETPPDSPNGKGVTFDLRCTTEDGTDILIEMQNYSQRLFKTRANYYLCRLMGRHVKEGFNWNGEQDIPKLLGIFILGKPIKGIDKLVTRTEEFDMDTKFVFWDRMRKYFISLPHLKSKKKRRWTRKEAWINIIKNLGNMVEVDERVYEVADAELLALIEKAKISALTPEEYAIYEAEMKAIGDAGSAECYGYDRGMEEGIAKGIQQGKDITIKMLFDSGMSVPEISQRLKMEEEDVKSILQ